MKYTLIYQNSHVRSTQICATLMQLTHDSLLKIRRKPERSEESPRRRIVLIYLGQKKQHYSKFEVSFIYIDEMSFHILRIL